MTCLSTLLPSPPMVRPPAEDSTSYSLVDEKGRRRRLTALQVRLVEEVLASGGVIEDGGVVKAGRIPINEISRRVGYSTADKGRLALKKPWVKAYMQRRMAEAQERTTITPERVLQQMRKLAFTDISEVLTWDGNELSLRPMDEMDPDAKAAIQSVRIKRQRRSRRGADGPEDWEVEEWEVKLTDKPTVLKMLADHLGLLGSNRQNSDEAWLEASRQLILRLSDLGERSKVVSFLEARGLLTPVIDTQEEVVEGEVREIPVDGPDVSFPGLD